MDADFVKVDTNYSDDIQDIITNINFCNAFYNVISDVEAVVYNPIWSGLSFKRFSDAVKYLDQYVQNVEQCRKEMIDAIKELILDTDAFVDESTALKWIKEG